MDHDGKPEALVEHVRNDMTVVEEVVRNDSASAPAIGSRSSSPVPGNEDSASAAVGEQFRGAGLPPLRKLTLTSPELFTPEGSRQRGTSPVDVVGAADQLYAGVVRGISSASASAPPASADLGEDLPADGQHWIALGQAFYGVDQPRGSNRAAAAPLRRPTPGTLASAPRSHDVPVNRDVWGFGDRNAATIAGASSSSGSTRAAHDVPVNRDVRGFGDRNAATIAGASSSSGSTRAAHDVPVNLGVRGFGDRNAATLPGASSGGSSGGADVRRSLLGGSKAAPAPAPVPQEPAPVPRLAPAPVENAGPGRRGWNPVKNFFCRCVAVGLPGMVAAAVYGFVSQQGTAHSSTRQFETGVVSENTLAVPAPLVVVGGIFFWDINMSSPSFSNIFVSIATTTTTPVVFL